MGWFTGKEPSPMLECGFWGVPFHQNITGGPGFSLHFHRCPISGILPYFWNLLNMSQLGSSYTVTPSCHSILCSQGCRKRGATNGLEDFRAMLDYQVSEYATGPPGFPRVLNVFLCFLVSPHVSCLQCLLYWNSSHSDYRCEKSWHYCSRSTLLGT